MRRVISSVALLAAFAVVGCGGKLKYWQPKGAPKQVQFAPDDKVFIMPVDIHVSKGDPQVLSASLGASFLAAYGSAAVPGGQVVFKPLLEEAGVYNLSWLLAEGMVHGAFVHGDATNFDEGWAEVPALLGNFFSWIRTYFNYPIRYIAVAHIDERALPFPYSIFPRSDKVAYLEVMGGVYDIEAQKTVSVINYFQKMPADTMAANMAVIGTNIAKFLACPSQDKACRDAAPVQAAPAGQASIENLRVWRNPAYY